MRVLIADDNKQILSVLRAYAERSGYTVDTASDGPEALQLAQMVPCDAILLDVMMPGKDGFEVCRELRKKSGIPIIMITARGEDYEKILGLDIGTIVKPFSPGEVMARIRAVLRRTENSFGERPSACGRKPHGQSGELYGLGIRAGHLPDQERDRPSLDAGLQSRQGTDQDRGREITRRITMHCRTRQRRCWRTYLPGSPPPRGNLRRSSSSRA